MAHKLKHHETRRSQPLASGRPPSIKLTAQDREAVRQALPDYHRAFHYCFYRREQRCWSALHLCGQLSNLERKTIEPMISGLQGTDANVVHAVQVFIGDSRWDFKRVIQYHQTLVAASLGEHSVGVARQYCGRLG